MQAGGYAMSVTLSARVPEETMNWLRREAESQDRSVSEVVNRALEEHIRCQRFPGILFVDRVGGRREAKVIGGPSVWSIVFVGREAEMDVRKIAEHFDIPEHRVRLALAYHRDYPEESESHIREIEAIADDPSLVPWMQVMKLEEL
jgi:hypothetical protein